MRVIVVIITFVLSVPAFSQTTQKIRELKLVASRLNTALMQKDSLTLKRLLHEKLTYGHSNGWIESKKEVIGDLFNGKLVYHKIEQAEPEIVLEGNTASLRNVTDIDVALDGNPVSLKLSVLQVWVKKRDHWVLLSRQSVRI